MRRSHLKAMPRCANRVNEVNRFFEHITYASLTLAHVKCMLAAMPRSKGGKRPKGNIAARLDEAIIARLDALMPLYELPGRAATRSDALRAVVLAGLIPEEHRLAKLLKKDEP
jgi:hypothetical protein